jgi:hypothetical protein
MFAPSTMRVSAFGIAVREPREYRDSREPPRFAKRRTLARRQPTREQFADQVLFVTASHVSETVEGCCLIFRQPGRIAEPVSLNPPEPFASLSALGGWPARTDVFER